MLSSALAKPELPPDWVAERARYAARIAALEHRIAWFERQLFGEKSERRRIEPPPEQMALGEGLGSGEPPPKRSPPIRAGAAPK